jgi:hypothetical protein
MDVEPGREMDQIDSSHGYPYLCILYLHAYGRPADSGLLRSRCQYDRPTLTELRATRI